MTGKRELSLVPFFGLVTVGIFLMATAANIFVFSFGFFLQIAAIFLKYKGIGDSED